MQSGRAADANDWGDLAVVSGTLGNNSNRLCLGAPDSMRPADIGCPSYAPSLSTAGHVSITGNVSANRFIGDGSGLTNLSVSGDRIVSDTHAVIVHEGTGYVSLTSAGTTWGYLSGGWSYLANLFTDSVSSSLVSATNVSATYVDATRNGTVSGTYGYFHYISGTNIHGTFTGDGSGLTGIGQGDRIASGTLAVVANSETSYVSLSTAGTTWGYLGNAASFLPTLTANRVSATNISGTLIQVGNNGVACSSSISGSLRYSQVSSTMEYCNSTAWVSMGPSDTVPVAFRAYKGDGNQTVTTNTWTKLTFNSETFDTNNNFDSSRFTATVRADLRPFSHPVRG